MNQLLESNVTFGFNPQAAVHAKRVTILASPDVVSTDLDAARPKALPCNASTGIWNESRPENLCKRVTEV